MFIIFVSKIYNEQSEIEAVECFCGENAIDGTEMDRLRNIDAYSGYRGQKNGVSVYDHQLANKMNKNVEKHCNMWIYAFNRVPNADRPCAFLFGSNVCETSVDGDKWSQLNRNWFEEIKPDGKVVNLPELPNGDKAKSARALIVKPGCSFVAFSGRNGNSTAGYKHITAWKTWSMGKHKPVFYILAPEYNPFGTSHDYNPVS